MDKVPSVAHVSEREQPAARPRMPPASAKDHWSGVDPGQPFTLTLTYDGTKYETAEVKVSMSREWCVHRREGKRQNQ